MPGNVTQSLLFLDVMNTLAVYPVIAVFRAVPPSAEPSGMILDSEPGEGNRSQRGCTMKMVRLYSASVHWWRVAQWTTPRLRELTGSP